jgi:hypothetical protein
MDLPTQRDTDNPTTTLGTELTPSDLDGAATGHATTHDTASTDVGDGSAQTSVDTGADCFSGR